jgi:uncharacterized protein (DUF488 family)
MPLNTLWTIGHSTRTLDAFLALLAAEKIQTIADVRRFPGSRRHPHFNREPLAAELQNVGITYTHFPALGGRRKPSPTGRGLGEGANSAWRVAAFAAYADYMLTDDFKAAFSELQTLATHQRTAIMCAEALPWRCHRRLIADQFIAQAWHVLDIVGPNNTKPHELPTFATITAGQVTYPGNPHPLFDD